MTETETAQRCAEQLMDDTGWHLRNCRNKPLAGSTFCRLHSPEAIKARADSRSEKWEAVHKAESERRRKSAAYDTLRAQRDALLEALEAYELPGGHMVGCPAGSLPGNDCQPVCVKARAAIDSCAAAT